MKGISAVYTAEMAESDRGRWWREKCEEVLHGVPYPALDTVKKLMEAMREYQIAYAVYEKSKSREDWKAAADAKQNMHGVCHTLSEMVGSVPNG